MYVTGLSRSVEPSDEDIELHLCKAYSLAEEDDCSSSASSWAGPGTTLVKRDDATGCCRGFAFLTFYSKEGASMVVDRINNGGRRQNEGDDHDRSGHHLIDGSNSGGGDASGEITILRAELSNPKNNSAKGRNKNNNNGKNGNDSDLSDLRLRRHRGKPIRKHPVITSSDGRELIWGIR